MAATMYNPKKRGNLWNSGNNSWNGKINIWDWVLMIIISLMVIGTCMGCSRTVLPAPSVTVKETIVERIIKDTVTIQLPSERIEVIRRDSSLLETKIAKSIAVILADGSLLHTIENKPSLPVQIEHKETIATRDSTIRVPYPVPGKDVIVYKQHWYQGLFMWIGIALLSIIGLSALGRWAWSKA